MSQKSDIEDLQKKVKELEKRIEDQEKKPPVFVPVPYPVWPVAQPIYIPPVYIPPPIPWQPYQPSYTNDWRQTTLLTNNTNFATSTN
jgi:hypothetical protein